MRTSLLAVALLLGLPSLGCATARNSYGAAETDLGLERVVLYRNGVGYFERSGEVDGDVLRIKVRRDQVNDLLKSLTVIDRKSGQAVSVSMPLDPQSWANAALSTLGPGRGSLAQVLDGLRGTEVVLRTSVGRIRGRVVMVERTENEPDPSARIAPPSSEELPTVDHKVTLVDGDDLYVVRLSKVSGFTLLDGDVALQLNRRLDASAGEGMFQQIEVEIRLAGAKSHDLTVSYVVEAPMWKPTYRVVLPKEGEGQALLQGWAVVDNTSGEDWANVGMSLTSGEPIAFEYDLHTPRNVSRADLTESGVRRRATVAVGETTYDYEASEAEEEGYAYSFDEAAPEPEPEMDLAPAGAASARATARRKAPKKSGAVVGGLMDDEDSNFRGGGAPSAPPPPPAVDYDALRRSTQAKARASSVAGMTRFDLTERVSVPNGSSTMVAILNREVDAEETFLFKPGGAGMGYDMNPYRVVRFKNSSPFVLEPGPLSIYAGGSFVGEGLTDTVGTGTSATVPFAVEPSILVTSSAKYKGDEMRLIRIVRGVLEVEQFSRTETTWNVRGPRQDKSWKVLVRHSQAGSDYELLERPTDTEDLPGAYLVPVVVPKGKTESEVTLVEQTPSRTTMSIWDGRAVKLMEQLLVSGEVTPQMRKKLQPIVDRRTAIGRIDTEIDGLKRQQVELDQRARQTRENLEAIKKDPAASSLRKKLSARLDEFTKDGDAIGRKIVELQSQRLEKKIELEDLLQDLDLRAPTSAKPNAEQ
ncbi:MAG: DUF4139 domain-containing protein [Nannocystaceae bacterium]|nr:DUF4139 domain-containing protein [bacterium]